LPELPEVETVRKGLEKLLNNFYIERIEVLKERSIASIGGSSNFINNINYIIYFIKKNCIRSKDLGIGC